MDLAKKQREMGKVIKNKFPLLVFYGNLFSNANIPASNYLTVYSFFFKEMENQAHFLPCKNVGILMVGHVPHCWETMQVIWNYVFNG